MNGKYIIYRASGCAKFIAPLNFYDFLYKWNQNRHKPGFKSIEFINMHHRLCITRETIKNSSFPIRSESQHKDFEKHGIPVPVCLTAPKYFNINRYKFTWSASLEQMYRDGVLKHVYPGGAYLKADLMLWYNIWLFHFIIERYFNRKNYCFERPISLSFS